MQPSSLAKRATLILFPAVVAFYFNGLGQIPLVGPDEPRYTQVAREMLLSHDLITPTLGGHTWFEKPALLYWMMIASFKLFGVSEWAARLPAAVCGMLTIAAVFVVSRRVERDQDSDHKLQGFAFWSTLAAATTIGIIVFSRAASFDIVLTMTTTWALAFFALHEFERNERLRHVLLAGFYVFIGLSLLGKGLVGIVIPVGVVGLYYLLQRRLPSRITFFSLVYGVPLALVVAATWYVPVIERHGWLFIDQFIIQHHFARYVSDKYHHWRPVYYYLQVVPLLALPWSAFLFDGLLQFKTRLGRASVPLGDPADDRMNRLMVFALAWFLFPLVFFSFSSSKLPGYILPILPAAALIIGERLLRLSSDAEQRRWPISMTAVFCLLFGIGVLAYSWRAGTPPHVVALLIATPVLVAGAFPFLAPRQRTAALMFLAGATATVLIVALYCVAPAAAELESSKRLLQLADARGYSQTAIYGLQRSDRTPEFYAAGRVVYGADGEPIMYEGAGQVIFESRRRQDAILVFVPLAEVSQLATEASAQTEVIGNNGRYALVAVRAE